MRLGSLIILVMLLTFYLGTIVGVNIYQDHSEEQTEILIDMQNKFLNLSETQHQRHQETRSNNTAIVNIVEVTGMYINSLIIETSVGGVEYGYENVQTDEGQRKLRWIFPLILLYIIILLRKLVILLIAAITITITHLIKKIKDMNNKGNING